jgi:hypothetical protein
MLPVSFQPHFALNLWLQVVFPPPSCPLRHIVTGQKSTQFAKPIDLFMSHRAFQSIQVCLDLRLSRAVVGSTGKPLGVDSLAASPSKVTPAPIASVADRHTPKPGMELHVRLGVTRAETLATFLPKAFEAFVYNVIRSDGAKAGLNQ